MAADHHDVMSTLSERESLCMCCCDPQYVAARPLFVGYIDRVTAAGGAADQEMVHTAFALMDVFFSRSGSIPAVDSAKPFLCAALLIACKLHSNMVGVLDALVDATRVPRRDVCRAELSVLRVLGWNVNFTTTYEFLMAFNAAGMFGPNDTCRDGSAPSPAVRQRVLEYVQFFVNRSVRIEGTVRFSTSVLSAAAWCMARRMCAVAPEWGATQERTTWRTHAELGPCVEVTNALFLCVAVFIFDSQKKRRGQAMTLGYVTDVNEVQIGAGADDVLTPPPAQQQQPGRSARCARRSLLRRLREWK